MAVQISRRIYPEVSKKDSLWGGEEKIRASVSNAGGTEGVSDRGGAHYARSRSHAYKHSAEVCGFKCGGLHQGQECNPCSPAFLEEGEELCGPESLGAWQGKRIKI